MVSDQQREHKHPLITLFAPDHWGTVTRFCRFAHTTYRFRRKSMNALRGVEGHFSKYSILRRLAESLAPMLEEDIVELEKQDYSNAKRSRQVAGLVETLFCELYSSLDCMREVLGEVLRDSDGKPLRGVTSQKTSRLFSNAAEGKLDPRIPTAISAALATAQNTWFVQLRDIRTQVVHFDVGICGVGSDRKVFYMNPGLGSGEQAFVVEDVFGRLGELEEQVNRLLGIVFAGLLETLRDVRTRQPCCLYKYRMYERMISPKEVVNGRYAPKKLDSVVL